MNTKQCRKCKNDKDLSEFGKDAHSPDGLKYQCKECSRKESKTFYDNNTDKIKISNNKYRNGDFNYRFALWKANAKRRNIPFELNLGDIKSSPLICYYTGTKLTLNTNQPNTISLDRIDNSKGYTKDNVVFCCQFVNYMKGTLTHEQFIFACKLIIHTHENRP